MPDLRFDKGDRVKFRLVTCFIEGIVKEDRGPIGVKARRLYLIEFRSEPQAESLSHIELPADELQPVQNTVMCG